MLWKGLCIGGLIGNVVLGVALGLGAGGQLQPACKQNVLTILQCTGARAAANIKAGVDVAARSVRVGGGHSFLGIRVKPANPLKAVANIDVDLAKRLGLDADVDATLDIGKTKRVRGGCIGSTLTSLAGGLLGGGGGCK